MSFIASIPCAEVLTEVSRSKEKLTPLGLPRVRRQRATVVSYVGGVSYERDTSVRTSAQGILAMNDTQSEHPADSEGLNLIIEGPHSDRI